jgi:MFS family permease
VLPPDAGADLEHAPKVSRTFAWIVFALTSGLLLSDYMSRQVLNAVFPVLKLQWSLTDAQLGSLNSIVSLLVGLLAFPLAIFADRWGRVRGILAMAVLWSLATAACAIAQNYGQMLAARALVGVGEAAYGSVGIALIISVFPPHLRSSLSGSFLAAGAFGSVLGMAVGGVIAAELGWRWAFGAMASFGFALVLVYAAFVTEKRLTPERATSHATPRQLLLGLFSSVSICCAYVGSGLQLFVMGSMMAWLPSYVNRYYALPTDESGLIAAVFVLLGAIGMAGCGIVADRLSRSCPARKWMVAIGYSVLAGALLRAGFEVPTGPVQLALLGAGMLLVAGATGPVSAMVANLTRPSMHAAAFATLALASNLLGMAPGPFLTGMLADHVGLLGALKWMTLAGAAAVVVFVVGYRNYDRDLQRVRDRACP